MIMNRPYAQAWVLSLILLLYCNWQHDYKNAFICFIMMILSCGIGDIDNAIATGAVPTERKTPDDGAFTSRRGR